MFNVKMYGPNKFYAVDAQTGKRVAEGTTADEAVANATKPVMGKGKPEKVVEVKPVKRSRKATKQ